MSDILKVNDLTVSYSGQNILNNVNLTLGKGEILGIVGESGSGKSTLIRTIMDILPPNGAIEGGEVVLGDKLINELDKETLRDLRGNEIAMIFQNPGTYLNPIKKISAQFIETIMNHKNLSKDEATELAKTTIEKMNLSDSDRVMESYPFELSGGMLQRVYIAMTMALQPKIILADEPTSALDVSVCRVIVEEMMSLRDTENTSFIVVTHDIGIASHMADRIIVMKDGCIVEMAEAKEIITKPKADYTKLLIDAVPRVRGSN